jgi:hypothetical protein
MRSEILAAVKMMLMVFWVVRSCGLVSRYNVPPKRCKDLQDHMIHKPEDHHRKEVSIVGNIVQRGTKII